MEELKIRIITELRESLRRVAFQKDNDDFIGRLRNLTDQLTEAEQLLKRRQQLRQDAVGSLRSGLLRYGPDTVPGDNK